MNDTKRELKVEYVDILKIEDKSNSCTILIKLSRPIVGEPLFVSKKNMSRDNLIKKIGTMAIEAAELIYRGNLIG